MGRLFVRLLLCGPSFSDAEATGLAQVDGKEGFDSDANSSGGERVHGGEWEREASVSTMVDERCVKGDSARFVSDTSETISACIAHAFQSVYL